MSFRGQPQTERLDAKGYGVGANVYIGPQPSACLVGWFVSLLVREKVLLAGLCERKILFQLKFTIVYDKPQQNKHAYVCSAKID